MVFVLNYFYFMQESDIEQNEGSDDEADSPIDTNEGEIVVASKNKDDKESDESDLEVRYKIVVNSRYIVQCTFYHNYIKTGMLID